MHYWNAYRLMVRNIFLCIDDDNDVLFSGQSFVLCILAAPFLVVTKISYLLWYVVLICKDNTQIGENPYGLNVIFAISKS